GSYEHLEKVAQATFSTACGPALRRPFFVPRRPTGQEFPIPSRLLWKKVFKHPLIVFYFENPIAIFIL
ncbi:MAG: hypothetical protein ACLUGG_11205, partial [Oscillospiraceae bacterium]